MKKFFLFIFLACFSVCAVYADNQENKSVISVDASIMVKDMGESAAFFVTEADRIGGYTVLETTDYLKIRIPAKAVLEYKEKIEKTAVLVDFCNLSTVDETENFVSHEKRLKENRALLKKYSQIMGKTDFAAALEAEKAMLSIVSECENLEGQINRIKNSVDFALFSVSLRSSSVVIPDKKDSSFQFVDSMDFDKFMRGEF